ncbi:MAG: hypothetical protein ABSC00_02930 [Acidimicrobiales bacterium]|jgi:cell division protein FtsB
MALAAPQVRSRRQVARDLPSRERRLKVVEGRRRHPHRTGRFVVLAVALALGSLLAVAGAQAYLTQGQVRLTRLQEQLNTQLGQHRDLELRVAQLEQPANVLSEAQKQGLVAPNGVTDLPQVNPPASSGSTTSTTSVRPSSTGATGVRAQSSTGTAAARSGGR